MDGIAYECKRCGHLHLVAHHQGYCSRCLYDDYKVVEVDIVKRGTPGKFDADIIFDWAEGFTSELERSANTYEDLAKLVSGYHSGRHQGQADTMRKIAYRILSDIFGKEARDGTHTADKETEKANAILISAAPDLLRACISALAFVEELEDHGITNWTGEEKLRKAITKATQTGK